MVASKGQIVKRNKEYEKLDNLLNESRHNLPVTARPETYPEWKCLRPNNVSGMAAGSTGYSAEGFDSASEGTGGRVWVPDTKHGFIEGIVENKATAENNDANAFVVVTKNDKLTIAKEDVEWMNPAGLELCENMSLLVSLNHGSVLHNLRQRYKLNLIHTYSGLFCISINPWKELPIYTHNVMRLYKGQGVGKMPPHVYAVADTAYNNLLTGGENQSILITGESGAGKTENTKKIMEYLSIIGYRGDGEEGRLEEQILQSNPVLESFGNAKTHLNDNSSRFGKFTRIFFDTKGKVCGAEMESYLLETSRVHRASGEDRSYHIFYQLLSDAMPKLKQSLHLEGTSLDYRFLSDGLVEVDSINDAEDMMATHRAMTILGFSEEEKYQIYKLTAGVLLLGQIKFFERGEQAYAQGNEEGTKVSQLLGISCHKFLDAVCEPTVKVGDELVKQSRNLSQVLYSVSAVAKGIYERVFRWLIYRCNLTLRSKADVDNSQFIGLLDIAGFEIFPVNSFEQLCINYTNEKLQQFFNTQMFMREQEEYALESIPWDMVDYGADLQPTIDLIEKSVSPNKIRFRTLFDYLKPMGILSMLEEECHVPKGSDKGLLEKLETEHGGKSKSYIKPSRSVKSKDTNLTQQADFSIQHYAGTVGYSVCDWLNKNKDPMNENVVRLFSESSVKLMCELWAPVLADIDARKGSSTNGTGTKANGSGKVNGQHGKRSKTTGSFLTVTAIYRSQLSNLLGQLKATRAHFVRCIQPNKSRRPGLIDANLVLHQLKCNGVLEGIRIAKQGYPNKILFHDFGCRYRLLDAEPRDWILQPRQSAQMLVQTLNLKKIDEYQIGKTKIFFRTGVLGLLEKLRMDKLTKVVTALQSKIRAYAQVKFTAVLYKRLIGMKTIQRNVRQFAKVQGWEWYSVYQLSKPQMGAAEMVLKREMDALIEERDALAKMLNDSEADRKRLADKVKELEKTVANILGTSEQQLVALEEMRLEKEAQETLVYDMNSQLKDQGSSVHELKTALEMEQSKINQLERINANLSSNLHLLEKSLLRERESREQLVLMTMKSNSDLNMLQKELQEMQNRNLELAADLEIKRTETGTLNRKVDEREDIILRLRDIVKRQRQQIYDLEANQEIEREDKRRAHKYSKELEQKLEEALTRIQQLEINLVAQVYRAFLNEVVERKSQDHKRASDQVGKMQSEFDSSVDMLRNKHASTITKLQDQIEQLQMKNIRLESENKQLHTILERNKGDDSPAMSSPSGTLTRRLTNRRHSSMTCERLAHQLASIKSGSPGPLSPTGSVSSMSSTLFRRDSRDTQNTRMVENLERDVKEMEKEKIHLTREIDEMKRVLKDIDEEKEASEKHCRTLRTEVESLSERLSSVEARNSTLEWDYKKSCSEVDLLTTKIEDMNKERAMEKSELESHIRSLEEDLRALQKRASLSSPPKDPTPVRPPYSQMNGLNGSH